MAALRPELGKLPSRMQMLPIDDRGYVVPWFVAYVDGKPEFRAMDPEKYRQAVRFKMCWVCGGRLGRFMTFVAGPMCGINRTSSEPPCHKECAEWSAVNCPFLNNPDAIRRVDAQCPVDAKPVGGHAILRNPGVTMLWTTKDYSLWPDGKGGVLVQMGDPIEVEWYAHGRKATRTEVLTSIETGYPNLAAIAILQDGGLAHLRECRENFLRYVPVEEVDHADSVQGS